MSTESPCVSMSYFNVIYPAHAHLEHSQDLRSSMAPSFLLGCALVALVPLAKASHFITRQAARDDVQLYTKQVRSALEAIDGIRDNNASEACADTTYASRLNERDFDGQLAQTLLCATLP